MRVKNRGIDLSKYDEYDKMAPNYRPTQKKGKDTVVYESVKSYSHHITADLSMCVVVLSAWVMLN